MAFQEGEEGRKVARAMENAAADLYTQREAWGIEVDRAPTLRLMIRAKGAAHEVSAWMAGIESQWIAFGPDKAAEDAPYDIALEVEAVDEERKYSITIISDLEKGFEKVRHDTLAEVASEDGLPYLGQSTG